MTAPTAPVAPIAPLDDFFMQQALAQAQQALYLSSPNPRVGCVLTSASGQLLGQGFTQQAGGPHAEVMALRDAAARGHSVQGATAYVTLEPCAHQGRTGPCCDALIAAGIARVVASLQDPNPLVGGQGFARLRAAGVRVDVGAGAQAARELNIGFLQRMTQGRPWVRMKAAGSLDAITALESGESQWITGADARADGQRWRARACALLTGSGTVLADNPRLDVRALATPRQPQLVVLDSALRTPPDAAIFIAARACLIYFAADLTPEIEARRAALQARGATLIHLPGMDGRVALPALLSDLGARGINELHVEAGARLNGALVQAGLVDEYLLYLAPQLLGSGRPLAAWPGPAHLSDARRLHWHEVQRVGEDLRLVLRA